MKLFLAILLSCLVCPLRAGWFFAAATAGGGPTYLLTEGFDGTGYENSWSETGVADEDYTGVVLVGSQSLRINPTASAIFTLHTLAGSHSTMEAYFQIRFATVYDTERTLLVFLDSGSTTVFDLLMRVTSTLRIRAGGGAPAANTTDAMTTGVTYHVWVRYVKGSGADAFGSVEFSTTGTRVGSGTKYAQVTTGPSTGDANKIRFGPTSSVTTDFVVDRVLVDDAAIGSSP